MVIQYKYLCQCISTAKSSEVFELWYSVSVLSISLNEYYFFFFGTFLLCFYSENAHITRCSRERAGHGGSCPVCVFCVCAWLFGLGLSYRVGLCNPEVCLCCFHCWRLNSSTVPPYAQSCCAGERGRKCEGRVVLTPRPPGGSGPVYSQQWI